MKAIRVKQFGGPEALELEETDDLQPGSDEVLVRIHAAGLNPVDTYVVSGMYGRLPDLPFTPGFDGAGVVEKTGNNVKAFKKGDRVYFSGSITGTYAEQALCNTDRVYPLPENISFEQGAALGIPYFTAYRALFHKANARPGETVLIHGASGGVGLAAVQIACDAGMNVIGTAGSDDGIDLVKKQGAHYVLNHHDKNHFDKALAFTDGKGIDVILEMLANVNLAGDLPLLAHGGRVIVIGSKGPVEINPRELMSRDATIAGMLLFNTPTSDLKEIHSALYDSLASGSLKPVIQSKYDLKEAPKAFSELMNSNSLGKIVLVC